MIENGVADTSYAPELPPQGSYSAFKRVRLRGILINLGNSSKNSYICDQYVVKIKPRFGRVSAPPIPMVTTAPGPTVWGPREPISEPL